MTTVCLEHALQYVEAGLSVIPLWQVSGDIEASKRPAISKWKMYQTQLPTPNQLTRWFGNESRPQNIALITGRVSGNIVALDFDKPGMFERWTIVYPEITQSTAIAKTGKGHHLLLRLTTPVPGNYAPAYFQGEPIGETRGEGGYIVVWPSIHGSGHRYEWLRPPWEGIAEVASLEAVGITKKPDLPQAGRNLTPKPSVYNGKSSAYAKAAFQSELEKLNHTTPGDRNNQLNTSAFALGQLIGEGLIPRSEVEQRLEQSALNIGLGEQEIRRTIRSGIEAGLKQPRYQPPNRTNNIYPTPNRYPTGQPEANLPEESPPPDSEMLLDAAISAKLAGQDYVEFLGELVTSLVESGADALRLDGYAKQVSSAKLATKKAFFEAIKAASSQKKERERANLESVNTDNYPTWPYGVEGGKIIFNRVSSTPGELVSITPLVVADFTARITAEVTAEDGACYFRIGGQTVHGRPFTFDITSCNFAQPQQLKAMLVQHAGAQAPVAARMEAYLGPAIQKFTNDDLRQIRRFDRVGWHDGKFLLPGREPEDVMISLPSKLCYGITQEADLQSGLTALQYLSEAFPSEQITILISFLFQPPLAQLAGWRDSDRYALFIVGQTGTFKTSTVQIGLSIYGPGFLDDTALIRWGEGGTRNAIMDIATRAADMLILIDNYKPSLGGGEPEFYRMIHALVESGEKLRLNRASELRDSRPIYAWPIFTGEDVPDKDPASLARVLILSWKNGNPEKLSRAHDLVPHLSAVGHAWLTWLETDSGRSVSKETTARYAERRTYWAKCLRASDKDTQNVMRVASNLASNELTWQVMALNDSPVGEIARKWQDAHQRGLEAIAARMAHQTAAGVEATRFLEALQSLISSGRCILTYRDSPIEDHVRDRHIGWKDDRGVYLDSNLAMKVVLDLLGRDGLGNVSKNKIHEQLDQMGLVASKDEKNKRIPVVRRCSDEPKRVLHLKLEALSVTSEEE